MWQVCAAIVFLLAAAGAASGADTVQSGTHEIVLDKVPAWVLPRIESDPPSVEARAGTSYGLVDTQIDWRTQEAAYFTRIIIRVTNNEALKLAGEITLDFNPAYEKLVLHEVTLVRDGARLNRLDRSAVRVVQQERDLNSQRLLTGRANAIVVVSDVRIGDQIEYAFTTYGDNPVLGDKRYATFPLAYLYHIENLRARLLTSPARPLYFKSFLGAESLQKTARAGYDEYLLVKKNIRAITPDALLAFWYYPWPRVQASEYASWADVGDWGKALFTSGAPPPAVAAMADRFRREAASPEDAAARALRFVQEEIRYLSIAIGQSAYRPADPATVLERRYGDCKDKANLFIAVARYMGFEAWPAVVSVRSQHQVGEFLPGAQAFDHVIVVLRVNGRTYWVDPTEAMQATTLDRMRAARYGYALILDQSAASLTAQPDSVMPVNELAVKETIAVGDFKKPARMTLEITASGQDASDLRRSTGAGVIERYMAAWQTEIERTYPRSRPLSAFAIEDDRTADRWTVKQVYELPDVFYYERGTLYARVHTTGVIDFVQLRAVSNRAWPLALGRPGTYRHSVRVELPEPIISMPQPLRFTDADNFISFTHSLELSGQVAAAQWTVALKRDHAVGDDIGRHMERRKRWIEQYATGLRVVPQSVGAFTKQVRARLDQRIEALTKGKLTDAGLAELRLLRFDTEAQETQYFLDRFSFEPKYRSELLVEYATALSRQGKRAAAAKALDEALALDAQSVSALLVRGELLTGQGRMKEALTDFDRAERLGADSYRLALSRGRARFYAADYAFAAADFKSAVLAAAGNQKTWPLLWLYLAAARSGDDPVRTVKELQPTDEMQAWPAPMLQFLTGAIEQHALHNRAKATDPILDLERRCEMLFYMGQSAALKGDSKKARELFEAARATQAVWFVEHAFAGLELDRGSVR